MNEKLIGTTGDKSFSTLVYEAQVQQNMDKHWQEVAQKDIREKRKELEKKLQELNEIEQEFQSLQNPNWSKSMSYSEKVKYL